MNQKPKERAVRLVLDQATHDQLRQAAARARVPMSAFVRKLVEDALRWDRRKQERWPG